MSKVLMHGLDKVLYMVPGICMECITTAGNNVFYICCDYPPTSQEILGKSYIIIKYETRKFFSYFYDLADSAYHTIYHLRCLVMRILTHLNKLL